MSWRETARLAAVLVALAAVVWWVERHGEPRRPPEATLLDAPAEDMRRIELDDPTGRIVAERSEHGWRDPAGRPWRTDAPDDLLRALRSLRPTVLHADGEPRPEEWGFGPDAMRLRVLDAAGQAGLALEIGRRNPAWTARYARRVDRREVLLVGAVLEWEIDKLRASAPAWPDRP